MSDTHCVQPVDRDQAAEFPLSFLYELATRQPDPRTIDWQSAFVRLHAELDRTCGDLANQRTIADQLRGALDAGVSFEPTATVLKELSDLTHGDVNLDYLVASYEEKAPWRVWLAALSKSIRGATVLDAITLARAAAKEHRRIIDQMDHERIEKAAAAQHQEVMAALQQEVMAALQDDQAAAEPAPAAEATVPAQPDEDQNALDPDAF